MYNKIRVGFLRGFKIELIFYASLFGNKIIIVEVNLIFNIGYINSFYSSEVMVSKINGHTFLLDVPFQVKDRNKL